MYEENIIKCTVPSIEDIKDLPKEILKSKDWWWLRSPGNGSLIAAGVNYLGFVYRNGNYVDYTHGVRPLLITNLKSENLKLYDIYKIFDIEWYYIGDGNFLSKDILFESPFDVNSNDYETSELKKRLDDWFNELKKNMPQENTLSPNDIKETTKDSVEYNYNEFMSEASKTIEQGIYREALHIACPTAEAFEDWIKRVKEIYYSEPPCPDSDDDKMLIFPTPASEKLTEEDFKYYKKHQIEVSEEPKRIGTGGQNEELGEI